MVQPIVTEESKDHYRVLEGHDFERHHHGIANELIDPNTKPVDEEVVRDERLILSSRCLKSSLPLPSQ
ncbi:MAG: hypothetical protein V3W41_09135 [Planctomycetota bacterium]